MRLLSPDAGNTQLQCRSGNDSLRIHSADPKGRSCTVLSGLGTAKQYICVAVIFDAIGTSIPLHPSPTNVPGQRCSLGGDTEDRRSLILNAERDALLYLCVVSDGF